MKPSINTSDLMDQEFPEDVAHAETLPWRRPNSQLLLRSCVMVMQAWAKCDPGVRQHLKELWALDDHAVTLHFLI